MLQVDHDAIYRVEFAIKDVNDKLVVPYGLWGDAQWLEPIIKDHPAKGPGGVSQFLVRDKEVQAIKITNLKNGKVVWKRK